MTTNESDKKAAEEWEQSLPDDFDDDATRTISETYQLAFIAGVEHERKRVADEEAKSITNMHQFKETYFPKAVEEEKRVADNQRQRDEQMRREGFEKGRERESCGYPKEYLYIDVDDYLKSLEEEK